MKYIFVAGAPGSKWSSVVKNIYYSPDINRSDYSDARTYYHDASGEMQLMHLGAYFDPGMEFDLSSEMNLKPKEMLEQIFDSAFEPGSNGVRIIKSHIFCNNIDFIRKIWPDCPIVLVHRNDDSCLGWWVKCGHFNITYPLYHEYYKDLPTMAKIIKHQNKDLLNAWWKYQGKYVTDNKQLCGALGIEIPVSDSQDYIVSDVRVMVI